jgi:arabinan endo-1,5-alpha-L-arabinosidase
VSAFGKNTSCIGVATSPTLNTASPEYHWTDHGKLIQSVPGKTNWNAIDPNLVMDKGGHPYLVFGSFWGGIKLVRLSKDRLSLEDSAAAITTLASRMVAPVKGTNPIEAPFIIQRGRYFYLFASIDYCCKGPQSTYKMIAGRSAQLAGPYVDKEGKRLDEGGGTLLLQGNDNWYGVGHNGIYSDGGEDYLVFHGYDAADKGRSKLIINKLLWTGNWPQVQENALNIAAEPAGE